MCNWLHICGFKVTESKKGIYYDGHERDDVVEVSNLNNITYYYCCTLPYQNITTGQTQPFHTRNDGLAGKQCDSREGPGG